MPKVKIDGREIEVPKGTTVLQAAENLGFEVPQMCYHPGLSIVGVCRVCLCQIKGSPKMAPACATEVSDGMEIGLYTPESEKARRAVIEFWLLNHPLDCPVCDQGGECPLQDIAFDHGPGVSRLNDVKVKKAKRVDLGPHVVLDEERCILCWRCTRFTQEISETNQIMLRDRGVYTTVGTPPGETLDDPFSGNVVDLCPVGALTSHDFRFKSRVWEMSSSESVCTACSVNCNTYVWSKKGRVERLTSRPNPAVNDYWLCDRGKFGSEFVNQADRLLYPRIRVDGKLVEVEWPEAIEFLARGLRSVSERGHNQAGMLFTQHLSNEEYWGFQKFARSVLGTNHLSAGRTEFLTPARVGLRRKGRLLDSVQSLDDMDAVLIVGGDLEKTHPVYSLRLRKARRARGTRIFQVTPETGRLDEIAERSQRLPVQEAAAWLRSGASKEGDWGSVWKGVRRLAVLLNGGESNPALVDSVESFLGSAPDGAEWKTLILDPGGNPAGAMAMGISPRFFPGFQTVGADTAQVLKSRWGGRVAGEAGLEWNPLLRAAGEGTVRALFLVNAGRPANWNFTPEEKTQLGRAPFVAAFDLFAGEVEEFAHVILPTQSFVETDSTTMAPDGLVQLSRRNIVPKVPTALQILHRTAGHLGTKIKGPQPIEVFREIAREVPGFAGLDYGKASGEGARSETAALAGAV